MKTIEAPAAERASTPIFEQLREEFGFTQLTSEIAGEAEQDDSAEAAADSADSADSTGGADSAESGEQADDAAEAEATDEA